jgi:hypothetical protein
VAAQRQIDAAIAHLKNFELECAITLAAAAETMLPNDTTTDYAFDYLRRHAAFNTIDFNETVNWLKHNIADKGGLLREDYFAVRRTWKPSHL